VSAVRVRYQTLEIGDVDLHVRSLRDRQQFADAGGAAGRAGISSASWPLFGVVWESGKVLAQLMLGHEIAGLRVLEVGCGIGLASLVLRRRGADITATDQHPEARAFLDAPSSTPTPRSTGSRASPSCAAAGTSRTPGSGTST